MKKFAKGAAVGAAVVGAAMLARVAVETAMEKPTKPIVIGAQFGAAAVIGGIGFLALK